MSWEWVAIAGIGGVLVGYIIGRASEASLWRDKAKPDYRTAMCSGGRFFYVIPEREYVQRHLAMGSGEPRD